MWGEILSAMGSGFGMCCLSFFLGYAARSIFASFRSAADGGLNDG